MIITSNYVIQQHLIDIGLSHIFSFCIFVVRVPTPSRLSKTQEPLLVVSQEALCYDLARETLFDCVHIAPQ